MIENYHLFFFELFVFSKENLIFVLNFEIWYYIEVFRHVEILMKYNLKNN